MASGRAHRGALWEVSPSSSLVSPRLESRTPFHGWATPSEGRRAVANGGVLPPATGNENWARGVTGFFPPYTFNNRFDKYWPDQEVLYDYNADLRGIGTRKCILPLALESVDARTAAADGRNYAQ